jgi:hypothetical protein
MRTLNAIGKESSEDRNVFKSSRNWKVQSKVAIAPAFRESSLFRACDAKGGNSTSLAVQLPSLFRRHSPNFSFNNYMHFRTFCSQMI